MKCRGRFLAYLAPICKLIISIPSEYFMTLMSLVRPTFTHGQILILGDCFCSRFYVKPSPSDNVGEGVVFRQSHWNRSLVRSFVCSFVRSFIRSDCYHDTLNGLNNNATTVTRNIHEPFYTDDQNRFWRSKIKVKVYCVETEESKSLGDRRRRQNLALGCLFCVCLFLYFLFCAVVYFITDAYFLLLC